MSEKGYELTESRYNVFIKQSFYRMQYRPPDNCTIEHIVRMNPAELEKHLERTFYERYGISTQKYIRYFGDSKLCMGAAAAVRLLVRSVWSGLYIAAPLGAPLFHFPGGI